MTDKEIIIDVNKCKYRDTYTNFCKAEKDDIGECYTICTGNDCYFKQLKRKEQECKQLKEKLRECRIGIKDISIESTEICKISEKYKQALDEIEKYLDAQQKYFDGEDYHNLLDIISKARGQKNDR